MPRSDYRIGKSRIDRYSMGEGRGGCSPLDDGARRDVACADALV